MFYNYSNIKIYYEVIGSGKPIIILHGLGCNLDLMKYCMEPIFETLSTYKRIYIDLPGMGKSSSQLKFANSDKILEILISFVNHITNDNFLLVGESYGGYLARGVLSRFKERVDGIMLLCPVVIPNYSKRIIPDTNIKFKDEAYLKKLDTNERTNFCKYAILANEQTHERYKKEILSGLEKADDIFISQLEQNYTFTFDVDNLIREINFTKPTLFICGRQDTCVGYKDLWSLIEDYPRATFSVIDVAGHNLQIEQSELFNSLVCNWILRVEKY